MESTASAPDFLACSVRNTDSFVLFEPAPAITGILFLACSITISITWQCSSWESVADSPVVPHGTIASVPSAI